MRKLFKTVFTAVLFASIYTNFCVDKVFAQPDISSTITYQNFYDALSPYGNWIEYPGYEHVWSPGIDGDFRPYLTNGSWEYTTEGWAWVSNYDWGWGPFHYGRWLYDPSYGWLWIPGYEWSPAWVTWGDVDDFYAWAPLYPGVNVGFAYNDWRPNPIYWNIVPRNHIYDRDVYRYVENRAQDNIFVNRIQIINNFNTTSIHNHFYSRGPEISKVEQYTGRRIVPVSVKPTNKMMAAKREGNSLEIYRPRVIHPQPEVFKRITKLTSPIGNLEEDRMDSDDRINPQETMELKKSESMNRLPERQIIEQARVPQNEVDDRVYSNERTNPEESMKIRRSQSMENVPERPLREQVEMPSIDRSTQRQNIQRMPEMRSPFNSFQRSGASSPGIRRKN